MLRGRILYPVALAGALVFYWAYREWLSWLILMAVVFTPWLGLLVSLPAMLSCRVRVKCAAAVRQGTESPVSWQGISPLPLGIVKGKLVAENCLTGYRTQLKERDLLPTEHCGCLRIQVQRSWVGDYLGLFRLPVRKDPGCEVLVRPVAVRPEEVPDLSRILALSLRPKHGGGYAEIHEMRLYQPGDNLRQIHWKLSAKVGKLMVRQPMESAQNRFLLTMELRGDPETLSKKLGQLLWMSRHLAGNGMAHEIRCLTGGGTVCFGVQMEADADRAVDQLLRAVPASADAVPVWPRGSRRIHIGGDGCEG